MFKLKEEIEKLYFKQPELLKIKKQLWMKNFETLLREQRLLPANFELSQYDFLKAKLELLAQTLTSTEIQILENFQKTINTLCSLGYSLEDDDMKNALKDGKLKLKL